MLWPLYIYNNYYYCTNLYHHLLDIVCSNLTLRRFVEGSTRAFGYLGVLRWVRTAMGFFVCIPVLKI